MHVMFMHIYLYLFIKSANNTKKKNWNNKNDRASIIYAQRGKRTTYICICNMYVWSAEEYHCYTRIPYYIHIIF